MSKFKCARLTVTPFDVGNMCLVLVVNDCEGEYRSSLIFQYENYKFINVEMVTNIFKIILTAQFSALLAIKQ